MRFPTRTPSPMKGQDGGTDDRFAAPRRIRSGRPSDPKPAGSQAVDVRHPPPIAAGDISAEKVPYRKGKD